jgi:hypothetical protein
MKDDEGDGKGASIDGRCGPDICLRLLHRLQYRRRLLDCTIRSSVRITMRLGYNTGAFQTPPRLCAYPKTNQHPRPRHGRQDVFREKRAVVYPEARCQFVRRAWRCLHGSGSVPSNLWLEWLTFTSAMLCQILTPIIFADVCVGQIVLSSFHYSVRVSIVPPRLKFLDHS